jgi:hypothetical protein
MCELQLCLAGVLPLKCLAGVLPLNIRVFHGYLHH